MIVEITPPNNKHKFYEIIYNDIQILIQLSPDIMFWKVESELLTDDSTDKILNDIANIIEHIDYDNQKSIVDIICLYLKINQFIGKDKYIYVSYNYNDNLEITIQDSRVKFNNKYKYTLTSITDVNWLLTVIENEINDMKERDYSFALRDILAYIHKNYRTNSTEILNEIKQYINTTPFGEVELVEIN